MQREVILVFGKSGEGKSYLVKHQLLVGKPRVVVFDTVREYHGTILHSFSEFVEYFSKEPQEFFVSCRFDTKLEYVYAARALWEIENVYVVLEECDNYMRSTTFSDPGHPFTKIVTQGRHKRINIIGITIRPHLVSVSLRSIVTHAYVFRHTEPSELAYLEEWGFDSDTVFNLARREYEEREMIRTA